MKPSTGGCAAFLNNPRSKFAQMTKDCLFERRRRVYRLARKLVFFIEISNQHAAKAVLSIQSPARQFSEAASERPYEIAAAFLHCVSITGRAIERTAASHRDMSCAPYAAWTLLERATAREVHLSISDPPRLSART
jgi:hypothetical protein